MKQQEDIFHLGLKALIRNKKGQILVLNANVKDLRNVKPHWDLPGGRIKQGEDIESGLRREVEEEIGIKDLKIGKLLDASISKIRLTRLNYGLILFTFLCSINSSEIIQLTDDEHIEFKWTRPREAAQLLSNKFSDSLVEKIKKL